MKEFTYSRVEPAEPISFTDNCVNCSRCVEACPIDVLIPGEKHPLAAWPDECWYCGCCVMDCPAGAIHLTHPMMNRVRWVDKATLTGGKDTK